MSFRPTEAEINTFIKQTEAETGGFKISRQNAIEALKRVSTSVAHKPPHSLENIIELMNAGVTIPNLISSKIPRSLLLRAKNTIQKRKQSLDAKTPSNAVASGRGNPFLPSSNTRKSSQLIARRLPENIVPNISTIERLNEWIIAETRINMAGPDIMTARDSPSAPGGLEKLATRFLLEVPRLLRSRLISLNPGQTVEKFREDISFLNNDYHMVYNTGGGVNDCLIISFLMGVSPAYRKLDYKEKYRLSSVFRRRMLPNLLRQSTIPEITAKLRTDANLLSLLISNDFLTDSYIACLAFMYRINIVSLETGKSSDARGEPPTVTFIEPDRPPAFPTGIIICNRGNGHYEIVVRKPNTYIYSEPELRAFYNRIQDSNPFVGGKRTGDEIRGQLESAAIPFRDGDYVIYRGQRYIIIERNIDASTGMPRVIGAWITLDMPDISREIIMNTAGISKLKKTPNLEQKLGTKMVKYVTPEQLVKLEGGKRNKLRKTRKLLRNRR